LIGKKDYSKVYTKRRKKGKKGGQGDCWSIGRGRLIWGRHKKRFFAGVMPAKNNRQASERGKNPGTSRVKKRISP